MMTGSSAPPSTSSREGPELFPITSSLSSDTTPVAHQCFSQLLRFEEKLAYMHFFNFHDD